MGKKRRYDCAEISEFARIHNNKITNLHDCLCAGHALFRKNIVERMIKWVKAFRKHHNEIGYMKSDVVI